MSDYINTLKEDKKWYKDFTETEVTGTCDNPYCDKKAVKWFGFTNRASCGANPCVEFLVNEREKGNLT